MAQLQELLKEDQEPFLLKSYISDRRSQIKRPSPNTTLQLKKRKPLHHHHNSTSFSVNLCKNASCIFSSFPTDTKSLTKSPLFELASPSPAAPHCRSPCKSPIFLHIPSRTAALLLEAALRIQKSSKTKSQSKSNNGFGLFGSFFKRLTQRSQSHKKETESNVSVKDVLKLDSHVGRRKVLYNGSRKNNNINKNNIVGNASSCEVGIRNSYNGSSSSVVWSESNEDKSLDMETSSSTYSSHSYDGDDDSDDEIVDIMMNNQKQDAECSCCHDGIINGFCESPFRFVLQRSPSSGRNTPELASPASSPSRHRTQDKESKNGAERLNKFQTGEEEEEDKEQCSPVSVLDPPFEDDDEGHGNDDDHDHDHEEEDGFNLECSYAIMQRANQQLLYKLRRFEKLAGLDPIELEKTMLDEEEDEDGTFMEEDIYEDYQDSEESSCKENELGELVFEALCKSSVHDRLQIPEFALKKLVSDLIVEERRELNSSEDRETVVERVCKRLDLWKEVETNTIDMMIEDDFSREDVVWKKNVDQMRDMAGELEIAIFGTLVEEFFRGT